jgi:hypothetical protein
MIIAGESNLILNNQGAKALVKGQDSKKAVKKAAAKTPTE